MAYSLHTKFNGIYRRIEMYCIYIYIYIYTINMSFMKNNPITHVSLYGHRRFLTKYIFKKPDRLRYVYFFNPIKLSDGHCRRRSWAEPMFDLF